MGRVVEVWGGRERCGEHGRGMVTGRQEMCCEDGGVSNKRYEVVL